MVAAFGRGKTGLGWLLCSALLLAACGGKASDPRSSNAGGTASDGGSGGAGTSGAGAAGKGAALGGADSTTGGAPDVQAGAASEAGTGAESPWPVPADDPLSQAVTFQNDIVHSGAQLNDTLRLPLEPRWEHVFSGMDPIGYPIVARERVFVGTYDRAKRSLDVVALAAATGEVLWTTRLLKSDDSVRLNLAYQDERLFGATGDGLVFAVDAAAGTEIWRREPSPPQPHTSTPLPVVANRTLFVMLQGHLTAISGATGAMIWRSSADCGTCAPTLSGSRVYLGGIDANTYAYDGTVYAFNRNTGQPSLKRSVPPLDPPAAGDGPATVGLLGERLLVRSHGDVWPLDLETDQLGPAFHTETVPVIADDWLFGSNDAVVSALEVGADVPRQWTYSAVSELSAAPVVIGGSLVIVAGAELVALDRSTGTVQSSFEMPMSFSPQSFTHPLLPTTGLVAAENELFVPLPGRLLAF